MCSHLKRHRSTKVEVERRRAALFEIISDMKPMTVRQVFYQASVHGLVEKAESGYRKVQNDLSDMRKAGDLPYRWLADNTRWQRKPDTFNSVEEALEETARFYRKSLWADADSYVEIWLEKDALTVWYFDRWLAEREGREPPAEPSLFGALHSQWLHKKHA